MRERISMTEKRHIISVMVIVAMTRQRGAVGDWRRKQKE